jgi:pyruvate/2-oxoglutarate dehydrogenase complex dihydrolipoamide acyltransferase (E2) component
MSTAVPIRIPKLGVGMSEGTLVQWLVEDSATVAAGDLLYQLETDKVENEIEAPAAGVIRLLAPAGEVYPVGTQIAEIAQG